MNEALIDKTREVQLQTSKKVIKKFLKIVDTEEIGCQAQSNDAQVIRALEKELFEQQ